MASFVPSASLSLFALLDRFRLVQPPPFISFVKTHARFCLLFLVASRSPVLAEGFSTGSFPPHCSAWVGVNNNHKLLARFSNEICPVRVDQLTPKEASKTQHRIPPLGKSAGICDLHRSHLAQEGRQRNGQNPSTNHLSLHVLALIDGDVEGRSIGPAIRAGMVLNNLEAIKIIAFTVPGC